MNIKKLDSTIKDHTQNALKKLSEFRQQIENIDDELYWVENSPTPLAGAYIKIEKFIQSNTKNENIEHFFHDREIGGLKPLHAKTKLDNSVRVSNSSIIGGIGTADLTNIICSLFGGNVEKALKAQAKEASKNIKSGPPLVERKQIKADLLAKRYKIEIDEEALISQAEELGLVGFYRRHDCNPEIVLMTEDQAHA